MNHFMYTVGIEYTFLSPPVFKGSLAEFKGVTLFTPSDPRKDRPQEHYTELMIEKGFKTAYSDGFRVVEVPSPVHRSMKGVELFYNRLNKARKQLKLTTHETRIEKGCEVDEANGGGHVHIGMPKFKDEVSKRRWWRNFTIAITNRPWLNWVFNQWCDDENAINIMSYNDQDLREYVRLGIYYETYDKMLNDKNLAVVPRSYLNTIEWRIFDAPRDFKDVQNFIWFAMAFTNHITTDFRRYESYNLQVTNAKDVKAFTKEECWRKFNELLESLGLDKRKYRRYKKNLNDRFKYGRLV